MARRARKSDTATNPRIASRTVRRDQPEGTVFREKSALSDEAQQKIMDKKIAKKREYANLAEELAEHKFYYRNWFWDHARTYFPLEPRLRHVELYFPFAKGGPLLIDQPANDRDQKIAERKQVEIKKAGFRYLILNLKMDENQGREALDKITNGEVKHGMDDPSPSEDIAPPAPS